MSTFKFKTCLQGLIVIASAVIIGAVGAQAAAPVLYRSAFRQSPVRAEPNDLLTLAGSNFAVGDRVAYQLVANTTSPPNHPSSIPSPNTASSGEATVIVNAADALTIRLPSVMAVNQSYILWVKSTGNQWSSGALINDARPLWISPDRAFTSQTFGGLPRKLKVVGRNLQPAAGQSTHVRLRKTTGKPATYDLVAENDNNAATAIETYAAIVTLPSSMTAATYYVDVNRDGTSWVTLSDQTLLVEEVTMDPVEISAGSPCSNLGCDDTAAVAAAIATVQSFGGGTVVLGAGTWKLGKSQAQAPDTSLGLVLPIGVSIRGEVSGQTLLTTVERRENWNAPTLFTVMGRNEVKNIKFKDTIVHVRADQQNMWNQSFILFGPRSSASSWGQATVVDTVMINGNVFDNAITALRDGGFPIRHLYVVNNTFGAWYVSIYFGGPWYGDDNKAQFNLEDSIFTGNTFKPGGYDDPPHNGAMATEIGAEVRVDFSNNIADGHATDYIYGSPPGFRAAFFTHQTNNHEMVLFSKNTGSCTGDRTGDGEFLDMDRNALVYAFNNEVSVASATSSAVTVAGTLRVPSPADFYSKHWVSIADGRGLGQARKIVSYSTNGGQVTFNVSPAWEVVPDTTSRIGVVREVWQAYIVDNIVDNTGCVLDSTHPDWTSRPESGGIKIWAPMLDSTIEGNVQTGTDGIYLHANYSDIAPNPPTTPLDSLDFVLKQFVEVRGNVINGEVNHDSNCSWSGIMLNYGSTTTAPTPIMSYAVSIGRNTVSGADGVRGGAIVVEDGWFSPPDGYPIVLNTLIHNNTILNLGNTLPAVCLNPGGIPCEGAWQHRPGIHLHKYPAPPASSPVSRTVLAGNNYPASLECKFLNDGTLGAVNIDSPPIEGWCPSN